MEIDDRQRAKVGLAICLRDMGNGTSRFFIDDVLADREENPIQWRYDTFCTFSPEFDNASIDDMNLTEQQFQEIGVAVVARLLALNGRVK
ncbi:MAG: hypothetical protein AB2735_15245 [Candidatus Thiodiazotropha taylori]|nr:hypothetical protein [Candidatus Thiodiazotropha taylori]MCW4314266.1 hypothetical protein [Candidatus Thiodiazotropha taylori]